MGIKILFIGGPLHMQTKDFAGQPAYEYGHPVIAEPALDPLETELRIARYRLRQVSIDQSVPPRYRGAPAVLDFRVYVAVEGSVPIYPEAARYLYQMYPEISVLPVRGCSPAPADTEGGTP